MLFPPSRPDASAALSLIHLVPASEPPMPAGFRHWREVAPPPGVRIKAVLLRRGQFRIERGSAESIAALHPDWTPHAWQRVPEGLALPPHWRAFPESTPRGGLMCCVMYFDLRGREGECTGLGRYHAGWPFGDFEERSAFPGEPQPRDPQRWAPYAWRLADGMALGRSDLGVLVAARAAAGGAMRVAV
jgi:hypothetical protein